MQVAYMSYYLFLTILGASIYRRRLTRSAVPPAGDPSGAVALQRFLDGDDRFDHRLLDWLHDFDFLPR